jgi:hypothetical protein
MKNTKKILIMLLVLLTLGTSFAFASSAYSLDDAQPGTESDAQDANPRYSGWEQIDSDIYFYKSDGTKTTGWTKINKKIFHFKSNGKLSLGLTKIGKKSFYFKKTGALGTKGVLQTGWTKIKKYKYYFKPSGKLGTKGKMITNQIAGSKKSGYAYVNSKGVKITSKPIKLAVKLVNKKTKSSQSKSKKLKACFNYIKKNFAYQRRYGIPNAKTFAREAEYMLKNKKGNCFCYASSFAYVARVLGYDSRVNQGVITTVAGGPDTHGWTEVKIGKKWYLFDISMHNRLNTNLYKKLKGEYPHKYKYYNRYVLSFSKNKAIWKKG